MTNQTLRAEEVYKILFPDWISIFTDSGCLDMLDYMLPELDTLYENSLVFPSKKKVFRAFGMKPEDVRVVILGQDPYHSMHYGQPDACGYSFLTENGYIPPSLENMFKELQSDDTTKNPGNGKHPHTPQNYPYFNWIKQGIMMLNVALTVECGLPGSHSKFWNPWSMKLIKGMVEDYPDIVWVLLGNNAQKCLANYDCKKVKAVHPSPLAGGKFFGSKIYSRTNELLNEPIIW